MTVRELSAVLPAIYELGEAPVELKDKLICRAQEVCDEFSRHNSMVIVSALRRHGGGREGEEMLVAKVRCCCSRVRACEHVFVRVHARACVRRLLSGT